MERHHQTLFPQPELLRKVGSLSLAAIIALGLSAAPVKAAFVELDSAGSFTVLATNVDTKGADIGIGSGETTITGDVGLGPNSSGSAIKATINGNLYVDKSSSTDIHTDLVVNGSTFLNQDLKQAVSDAFKASSVLAQLAPTQTFGDVNGSITFTGGAGRNVFSLNSVNEQGIITITGSASSQFVFNITNGFVLNGGSIHLTGGVTPDNILFNFNGSGDGIILNKPVGDALGIFLAPEREIILDKATLVGAVLGGGGDNKLVIHSGATLVGVIPEPSSYLAGIVGILIAALSHVKLLQRNKRAVAKAKV